MSRSLLLALSASLAAAILSAHASAAGCLAAAPECTEWLRASASPARVKLYRNYSLEARNEAITHAVIVIHGLGRDANNYYRHGLAAGFLAGALDKTLIVAPHFASNDGNTCRDALAQDETNWLCRGPGLWRNGGGAVAQKDLTTFDVMDALLQRLARRDSFPNLRTVVLVGHSAGGQYVSRYAMANRLHEKLPFPLTYVVSNPSSYTYIEKLRPTVSAMASRYPALPPGYSAVPANPPQPFAEFADAKECTGYNKWPYGLEERVGYAARLSDDELRRHYTSRPVTYLLGELDILPLYGFDSSCPAMAQGPTRLARGVAFAKYATESLGARHQTILVPACGHNARCMFGSDVSLPLLFPRD